MTFTSVEFFVFFLIVMGGHGLLRNSSMQKWFLLAASLFFCLVSSVSSAILIGTITLVDFSIGRRLGQTTDKGRRKKLLFLSLLSSFGLLGFFKYANFLLENLWLALSAVGLHLPPFQLNIAAPPGISFFIFASVSYIIDAYNKRLMHCASLKDYGLFLSFFPKLLSGPIIRAVNFLPQLKARIQPTALDIETGFSYLLTGAVKKLVIADQIVGHVNLIFSAPAQFDGFTLLQGMLGYSVQIYCDFSGYSDMAVGLARLLGFKLPENFLMPFSAVTISEYWRRWHITMSNWFRDYLFFPLEMARRKSRRPTLRTASNLIITFLVCGLWHGAGWGYILWGGIHGFAMAVQVAWRKWNPLISIKGTLWIKLMGPVLSRILTLTIILISGVYFRAPSVAQANLFMVRLTSWSSDGTRMISPYILIAVAIVVLFHLIQKKDQVWPQDITTKSPMVRILAYTCLLILVVTLGVTSAIPFVYFQF